MRTLVTALALGVTTLTFAGPVFADEVIIHRDTPVEVAPVAPPASDVVIEHRRPDCATTTTHRENGAGDSETVTRRECD